MWPFVHTFEAGVQSVIQLIALVIDLFALLIIAVAAWRAIVRYGAALRHHRRANTIERIRLNLGRSLVLALEFLIGADILRTGVTPSWSTLGQLGAIVLLRILLDFVLGREIAAITQREKPGSEEEMPEI